MTEYQQYLKTLRRIPAPIIQAMATRNIIPSDNSYCLCGWAVREALAFTNGQTADVTYVRGGSEYESQRLFGGTLREWEDIYFGIADDRFRDIEKAFTRRVAECVR